jgi:hypothetical protein
MSAIIWKLELMWKFNGAYTPCSDGIGERICFVLV